ncbi:MAG TPA: type II secretion system protein [Candidatus Methylacidiphilales bacterium]|jgi:prepilin-type N-terminal cleavage/methylation domain-containing protein|nr:type II secretion system protein [Candidatus Methylacidiphilales bacterium]
MKKFHACRRCSKSGGFTLVELLVVIAIIAILVAVTMDVGTTVLNIAKRTRAQNTAQQIQTAVLGYYTEYSVYPTPAGAAAADYTLDDADSAKNWGPMAECLSGMISPSSGSNVSATETVFSNSRQIAFLTFKATDVGNGTTGNLDAPLNPFPPAPVTGAGKYFNMTVDADYSGLIGPSDKTATTSLPNFATSPFSTTGGTCTAGVAIWANCNQQSAGTANWYVHTY